MYGIPKFFLRFLYGIPKFCPVRISKKSNFLPQTKRNQIEPASKYVETPYYDVSTHIINKLALFSAFPTVAVTAEHLAVFGNGAAALVPWSDVVGFHLLKLEMLATVGANAKLTLVGS